MPLTFCKVPRKHKFDFIRLITVSYRFNELAVGALAMAAGRDQTGRRLENWEKRIEQGWFGRHQRIWYPGSNRVLL
jgi:hypothetical protein